MNKDKIKELLIKYGVDESKVEDFIKELDETKEDIQDLEESRKEEEQGVEDYQKQKDTNNDNTDDEMLEDIKEDESKHEEYLLNAENIQLLKATEKGKDLLMNAPEMAKEELEKAIKEYLEEYKK